MTRNSGPGRPKGGRNIKPTRGEVRNYYELLRDRAEAGDVNAAAKLIELYYMASKTTGGWIGEDDSREKVIETIRSHEPESGQLPRTRQL